MRERSANDALGVPLLGLVSCQSFAPLFPKSDAVKRPGEPGADRLGTYVSTLSGLELED